MEEAARTGQSAIPVPWNPSKGVLPVPVEEASGEDPWALEQMQEERVRQQEVMRQTTTQQQQQQQNMQPPVDTKTPAVNALSSHGHPDAIR